MKTGSIANYWGFRATIETRLTPSIKNFVDEMKRDGLICGYHPVTLLALPLSPA